VTDNYRLHVSGFSGDAGDALANPVHPARTVNGMKFSTPDRDNDKKTPGQCDGGENGWWYNWCSRSCLNRYTKAQWNADSDLARKDVQFARMLVKLD